MFLSSGRSTGGQGGGSDALLASNRFAGPLPLASLWVLATYWTAQACIASWLAAPRGGGYSAADGSR